MDFNHYSTLSLLSFVHAINIVISSDMQYSASRGVFGTPSFYINGFALPDSGSSIDYKAWRSVIDPLLVAQGRKKEDPLHFFL